MLANSSDQPTQRMPSGAMGGEMTLANPTLTWQEMSYDEKARFLLVALRTTAKKPLPDPQWQSLVTRGLATIVEGSLMLSPVGGFLLQSVVETELAWLAEWV